MQELSPSRPLLSAQGRLPLQELFPTSPVLPLQGMLRKGLGSLQEPSATVPLFPSQAPKPALQELFPTSPLPWRQAIGPLQENEPTLPPFK